MFTALTPLARGLAMTTILVSLALAAGRTPAAHASTIGSGPVICAICPTLPHAPTLDLLKLTDKGSAMRVQGQGFSSWSGIDLYVWQPRNTWDEGSFAGAVHTTAHGSTLDFQIPVVASKQGQYCSHSSEIYLVAIDDNTHISSGVQSFVAFPALGCYGLRLSLVTTKPSLQGALDATKGTLHVSGHHYTPHTSVSVYLLQNGLPMLVPVPTTLTAKGTRFTAALPTGHIGCSNTLSWTTFALDQTANVASPLLSFGDSCYAPPK